MPSEPYFAANILKKHSIKSQSALLKWILDQNEELKQQYSRPEYVEQVKPSKRALEKAKKFDFYLGMEQGWLYK